jgi:transposase
MGRSPRPIVLTPQDRALLGQWVRAGSTPQRIALRARIILLAADGLSNRAIATRLSVSGHTVALWCERYQSAGVETLQRDADGRGRRPTVAADAEARVRQLLEADRGDGHRWTIRSLAAATGVSRSTVDRIWRAVRAKTDG